MTLILFNKPYDVLSQFTDRGTAGSTFNVGGGGTINLASMLPILTNVNGISIDGANGGQAITIDGGSSSATTGDRVFFLGVSSGEANVGLPATGSAAWAISNLTIANGNARGGSGSFGGGGGAGLGHFIGRELEFGLQRRCVARSAGDRGEQNSDGEDRDLFLHLIPSLV